MFSAADHEFMARALRLARGGLYGASPNPRVGAVVVRDGAIAGEGFHARAGGPHAEIHALHAAGARARGATAYVTLEPCSHHGRTPPCADALIEAGVARVVAALQDPNPLVAGQGLHRLQQAGIEAQCGLLQNEARELNIGFVSRMTRGRPWVRVKIAASLDGRTALNNGVSRWITNEAARRDGHRWRARSCALLTGIGTVLADDPELTVRYAETPRPPLKVVVDRELRIPLSARMLAGGNAVVFTAADDARRIAALENAGARVIVLPGTGGAVDLGAALRELARLEINEVLAEAGAALNGALLAAGLADELVVYLAPHLLGNAARGMFALPELQDMGGRRELAFHDLRLVGKDLRIIARPE